LCYVHFYIHIFHIKYYCTIFKLLRVIIKLLLRLVHEFQLFSRGVREGKGERGKGEGERKKEEGREERREEREGEREPLRERGVGRGEGRGEKREESFMVKTYVATFWKNCSKPLHSQLDLISISFEDKLPSTLTHTSTTVMFQPPIDKLPTLTHLTMSCSYKHLILSPKVTKKFILTQFRIRFWNFHPQCITHWMYEPAH
jgi:hypothetical protein